MKNSLLNGVNYALFGTGPANQKLVSSTWRGNRRRRIGVNYRTFLDSTGKRWEVWLVTPAAAERRRVDRRAAAAARGEDVQGFADRRQTAEGRKSTFRRDVDVGRE